MCVFSDFFIILSVKTIKKLKNKTKKMESNISSSTKTSEGIYEIKLNSNETFVLEMRLSEKNLKLKCKKSKYPYEYESLASYDSLLSVKQLKIYDNIEEIRDYFLQKLEKNEFSITEKSNELTIEFLIFHEKNVIPVPINLCRNDKMDLNFVVLDLIKCNTSLEQRVEVLEKRNLDLENKFLEKFNSLEQRLESLNKIIAKMPAVVWSKEPIQCWKCGQKNTGAEEFWKRKYEKNDGRCDGFVINGFWGICKKCDPQNDYKY